MLDTTENYYVSKITLHSQVSEVSEATVLENLSEYQWKGWSRYGTYWADNDWNADITSDGRYVHYEYTNSGDEYTGARVVVSVPGLDVNKGYKTYDYDVID